MSNRPGGDCVSASLNRRAAVAGIVAAAALIAAPTAAAKASCDDRPFQNWTRVTTDGDRNVAGVVFRPKGDKFHIWDNKRDDKLANVFYNYAGIDDEWEQIEPVFDGGQAEHRHNLREGRKICFMIKVDGYPRSPIVQYRTSR
jgi:hypothetical protein